MTAPDAALRDLAQAHGIHLHFFDLFGQRHDASPDTLRALLRAVGAEVDTAKTVQEALAADKATKSLRHLPSETIQPSGIPFEITPGGPCEWTLLDEAGAVVAEGRGESVVALPALPVGYFHLHGKGGGWAQETRILSRPAQAPQLPGSKCWGMTGALYGLRGSGNGGLGDYRDLGIAAAALGRHGAQFLGINPIHALGWAMEEIISPYSPSHRGYFNTDHIAVARGLGPTPDATLIDHPAFRKRHCAALEAEYTAFCASGDQTAFRKWQQDSGADLAAFAAFEAISETRGHDFRQWPAHLQTPGKRAVTEAGDRAAFHSWLQWQAETQVESAQISAKTSGMSLGLYLDLAVGPRPDGAEVWMNADTIARGVTIGAPPDQLSPEGQSWALAAHAPGPLAAANYGPLRAMLRKLMSNCGLLRIDHALGLLRSYWLPDDGSPGGYIAQPFDALLAVIAIEAHKAGCVVVGEDLGLVPDGFRDGMHAAGLYSYAVWQYESDADDRLRSVDALGRDSLACFGTHDTPTLQGFWYGNDIEWWQQVGWLQGQSRLARHAARARQRDSLRQLCTLPPDADPQQINDRIHAELGRSASALVSVQLDDAFGVLEAQNLPGTIDEHPNWRRRLPVAVEDFATADALRRIADIMPAERSAGPREDPL